MTEPEVSVVVCTRNRRDRLERCIETLLAVQTDRIWQLVIVDNASTDGTASYLRKLEQGTHGNLIISTAYEPQAGLGRARNSGIRAAAAPLIAFTDDDCYVEPNYIDMVFEVFRDPQIGYLGGRILQYDPSELRVAINETAQRIHVAPCTFVGAGFIQGANMAFRKTTLETIGGFDERMGAGTPFPCEDVDAAAAASWADIAGVFDPGPTVYHHHGRTSEADRKSVERDYDFGRGAYYMKWMLNAKSRGPYLLAWTGSIIREFHAMPGWRPVSGTSRRELIAGIHYLLVSLLRP